MIVEYNNLKVLLHVVKNKYYWYRISNNPEITEMPKKTEIHQIVWEDLESDSEESFRRPKYKQSNSLTNNIIENCMHSKPPINRKKKNSAPENIILGNGIDLSELENWTIEAKDMLLKRPEHTNIKPQRPLWLKIKNLRNKSKFSLLIFINFSLFYYVHFWRQLKKIKWLIWFYFNILYLVKKTYLKSLVLTKNLVYRGSKTKSDKCIWS